MERLQIAKAIQQKEDYTLAGHRLRLDVGRFERDLFNVLMSLIAKTVAYTWWNRRILEQALDLWKEFLYSSMPTYACCRVILAGDCTLARYRLRLDVGRFERDLFNVLMSLIAKTVACTWWNRRISEQALDLSKAVLCSSIPTYACCRVIIPGDCTLARHRLRLDVGRFERDLFNVLMSLIAKAVACTWWNRRISEQALDLWKEISCSSMPTYALTSFHKKPARSSRPGWFGANTFFTQIVISGC